MPTINIQDPQKYVAEVKSKKTHLKEISPFSGAWAEIIKPYTIFIFRIISGVIFIPLLLLGYCAIRNCGQPDAFKDMIDWAKTVLSPVIGFGASAVGFYFGTRSSNHSSDEEDE